MWWFRTGSGMRAGGAGSRLHTCDGCCVSIFAYRGYIISNGPMITKMFGWLFMAPHTLKRAAVEAPTRKDGAATASLPAVSRAGASKFSTAGWGAVRAWQTPGLALMEPRPPRRRGHPLLLLRRRRHLPLRLLRGADRPMEPAQDACRPGRMPCSLLLLGRVRRCPLLLTRRRRRRLDRRNRPDKMRRKWRLRWCLHRRRSRPLLWAGSAELPARHWAGRFLESRVEGGTMRAGAADQNPPPRTNVAGKPNTRQ